MAKKTKTKKATKTKTKKVRIAVAMREDGVWHAEGWSDRGRGHEAKEGPERDHEQASSALESLPWYPKSDGIAQAVYFVEVAVPVPTGPEVLKGFIADDYCVEDTLAAVAGLANKIWNTCMLVKNDDEDGNGKKKKKKRIGTDP